MKTESKRASLRVSGPLLVAMLGLVGGCGSDEPTRDSPRATFTISGTLRVHEDAGTESETRARTACSHAEDMVWVTTGSGDRVLALAQLGKGEHAPAQNLCTYALTIRQVPVGAGVYKVSLPVIAASELFTEPELRTGVDIELYPHNRA
ncbi:hypothetical protein ACFYO1_01570 [Nocardia sp. NPDC006044]|uniref:hypothetical protein n=1 Tax=Nocardia sp. NPDC006044 TaxID=3364306 RepID=UPI003696A94F